jgi:hypothetical protein
MHALNLINKSVNASPTVEVGLSTKSTIRKAIVAVVAVVEDTAVLPPYLSGHIKW